MSRSRFELSITSLRYPRCIHNVETWFDARSLLMMTTCTKREGKERSRGEREGEKGREGQERRGALARLQWSRPRIAVARPWWKKRSAVENTLSLMVFPRCLGPVIRYVRLSGNSSHCIRQSFFLLVAGRSRIFPVNQNDFLYRDHFEARMAAKLIAFTVVWSAPLSPTSKYGTFLFRYPTHWLGVPECPHHSQTESRSDLPRLLGLLGPVKILWPLPFQ